MTNYTITPINTGFTNTSKGQYLYHHSVHKFYDVEGFVKLPVTEIGRASCRERV